MLEGRQDICPTLTDGYHWGEGIRGGVVPCRSLSRINVIVKCNCKLVPSRGFLLVFNGSLLSIQPFKFYRVVKGGVPRGGGFPNLP